MDVGLGASERGGHNDGEKVVRILRECKKTVNEVTNNAGASEERISEE